MRQDDADHNRNRRGLPRRRRRVTPEMRTRLNRIDNFAFDVLKTRARIRGWRPGALEDRDAKRPFRQPRSAAALRRVPLRRAILRALRWLQHRPADPEDSLDRDSRPWSVMFPFAAVMKARSLRAHRGRTKFYSAKRAWTELDTWMSANAPKFWNLYGDETLFHHAYACCSMWNTPDWAAAWELAQDVAMTFKRTHRPTGPRTAEYWRFIAALWHFVENRVAVPGERTVYVPRGPCSAAFGVRKAHVCVWVKWAIDDGILEPLRVATRFRAARYAVSGWRWKDPPDAGCRWRDAPDAGCRWEDAAW